MAYIPPTTAPVTTTITPPIVSTTGVQSQFNDLSGQLDNFTNGGDPYAAMFAASIANEQAANKTTQDNAIATATASSANRQNRLNGDEAATLAGLATNGETSGASRYLPNYQAGIVDAAKQSYNQRFQLLDQQEKIAIANATAARNVADTKVVDEQLNYAKAIRTEKAKALQDAQNMAWKQYVFSHLSAAQQGTADRASAKINGGSGTYSKTQLGKLRSASIDPSNVKMADNFLYNKGKAPAAYDRKYLEDTFSRSQLDNLAKSLKIDKKGTFLRPHKNEIDAFFANPTYLTYVQDQLAQGYDIQDIIDSQKTTK